MCGMMEENTKGNIRMTRNMDLVYIIGQMEDAMKDTGTRANNME